MITLTNKVYAYILSVVILISGLFFLYNHIYNKGYEKAKTEYDKQLLIELGKQKKLSEIIVQKAQVFVTQEEKIKTVYKDRIVTIEKIVDKADYKEPVLSNEDYEYFKKAQEEVK